MHHEQERKHSRARLISALFFLYSPNFLEKKALDKREEQINSLHLAPLEVLFLSGVNA